MSFVPGSTYESEGPRCPYCGYQITADDPVFYDEQDYTEEECPGCGKIFDVEVCRSVDWSCHRKEDD